MGLQIRVARVPLPLRSRPQVKGNSHFAMRLSEYIPFMQTQLECGFNVADTIMEIFKDNKLLLEREITGDILDCFIGHLDHIGFQRQYINFLSELCVCQGQGIPANQDRICAGVLKDRSHLLLPLRLTEDWQLEIQVPPPVFFPGERGSVTPRNSQHDPRYANYWAPRTRKRHQQEHRPQRPTERSDPTQHAKGRTGDCPGPRKGATTRRNVTRRGGGGGDPRNNQHILNTPTTGRR